MANASDVNQESASTKSHFTYRQEQFSDDLEQGDVLKKTSSLVDILKQAHPHYADSNFDYTHFMVLSQTCDLVRRNGNGKCRTRYVSLAPVRPLRMVINRQIREKQTAQENRLGVCPSSNYNKMAMFVGSLLNNNNHDYFYINEDLSAGISERSCAFLRLSIGLRAYQHYDALLEARVISLSPEFQAKLGWLVGDLYSRVATKDWAPKYCTEVEFRQLIHDILKERCFWVDGAKVQKFSEALPDNLDELTKLEIVQRIKEMIVPSRKDKLIARVIELLMERDDLNAARAEKIRKILENDAGITVLTK